jgi:hypothetical protein
VLAWINGRWRRGVWMGGGNCEKWWEMKEWLTSGLHCNIRILRIHSVRYVFHHNHKIIVVIHIT